MIYLRYFNIIIFSVVDSNTEIHFFYFIIENIKMLCKSNYPTLSQLDSNKKWYVNDNDKNEV